MLKIIYFLYVLVFDIFIRNVLIFCYLFYIYFYQNLLIIKGYMLKLDILFDYKIIFYFVY